MTRSLKNKIVAASLAAVAVTLTGCGQDSITGLSDEFAGRPIVLPAAERRPAGLQDLAENSTTKMVSASNGGQVTLGRYTLDFPAGALQTDTQITITQTANDAMVLELLPHGIQFHKPVTLSAKVGDLVTPSAHTVGVAWMNDASGKWEVVNQTEATSTYATATLWHFSDYNFFEM